MKRVLNNDGFNDIIQSYLWSVIIIANLELKLMLANVVKADYVVYVYRLTEFALYRSVVEVSNMDLKQNKLNAINFYQMAYQGEPAKAFDLYGGNEYIQHNPDVANGKEGLVYYFTRMKEEYPDKEISFVRAIAEGNMVALHTHQVWPGNDEYITMDFFRFDEKGKIVEHWDSIQQIPNKTLNGNSMY